MTRIQQHSAELRITHLHYTHPDGSHALGITDLSIPFGCTTVVCGRNGAGKSLFALSLAGLLPRVDIKVEHVFNNEQKPVQLKYTELQQQSGIVFQNSEHQVVGQTVEEDIAFGLRNLHHTHQEIVMQTAAIMELCEITPLAKRHPLSLSGGELKRVAIAAMMVLEPQLLILDEPFLNLDWHGQQQLIELLRTLRYQRGITPLIITHNLYGAQRYAEWMVVMKQGGVIADGVPHTVVKRAVAERIAGKDATSLDWK